ncbi:resistin-like beta [Talpa occidentalis]|uniref:resistin-like beta n=1 Tax=Talpa occidentalis TaxID=50954 RepID=UPI00188F3974|nr:resistin-like beta [Talpa occidentalis]
MQVTPSPRTLLFYRMKPTSSFLLILIPLLQLIIPGTSQNSLDSIVDRKIAAAIRGLESKIPRPKRISCISVTNSGKLSTCPTGTVATSCACGYGCGSWDIRHHGTTCHCQCNGMDWTSARCCHLV